MSTNSNRASQADTRRLRVLVVEDEPSAREATARYLESRGYDVTAAADGHSALAAAGENPPDIVVSDWRLGDGPDGAQVAREIRRRCGAVIVLATAYPIDELREVTRDLEVARYFRKPVSLDALADAVANAKS